MRYVATLEKLGNTAKIDHYSEFKSCNIQKHCCSSWFLEEESTNQDVSAILGSFFNEANAVENSATARVKQWYGSLALPCHQVREQSSMGRVPKLIMIKMTHFSGK